MTNHASVLRLTSADGALIIDVHPVAARINNHQPLVTNQDSLPSTDQARGNPMVGGRSMDSLTALLVRMTLMRSM